MISFIVGSLALAIYILLTKQTASWAGIKSAPAHAWVGGLLGAFYVTVIILCFQRLGPGLTFGTVVAGQMVISLILEHFSVFGGNPQPFNLLKLAGLALIVLGVILIKRFWIKIWYRSINIFFCPRRVSFFRNSAAIMVLKLVRPTIYPHLEIAKKDITTSQAPLLFFYPW